MNLQAAALAGERDSAAAGSEHGAGPGRLRYPCSRAQQRFWVMDRLDPGNPALNVAVRWRLEGELPDAQLAEAWRRLLDRHEILRTAFVDADGEPMQQVEPRAALRIATIDLSTRPEAEALAEADRVARGEATRPFNLTVAPLIRVTRLRLSREVSILLVTAHHIVCDGWSIGVLAAEMGAFCAALADGSAPALPDVAVQYGDYAAWQQEWLAGADLRQARGFWQQALAGLAPFEVLPDHPRGALPTSVGRIASVLLDRALTDRVAALAKRTGCSLFMTALATLLVLLHRQTGETDIAVGTQVAGRDQVEIENAVGLFINTLILRGDLAGDPSFLALLAQVREHVSGAFECRQLPFEELLAIAAPDRPPGGGMPFAVNFIFQRSFIRNATYGGFRLVDLPSVSAGALYDLNFFMVERPEGWRASCEYNTDLFEEATVSGLLRRFEALLRAVADDPARPVSALPVLDAAGRAALLAEGNRTEAAYPRTQTLPALFAAQAARSPEALAVLSAEQATSYRELDIAANRLAQELVARGWAPGTRIGVLLERSTDLVVALLAVLKSGAAYVPLDPGYPAARLALVLGDAGLAGVITRGSLADRLAGVGPPALLLDEAAAAIRAQHAGEPPTAPAPEDDAYVIYTSGSTGRPKGVRIPHRALVNLLWAMRTAPGLSASDTLVGVTTIAFDIAALEVFLPLVTGARLVLATEVEAADGVALLRLLRRHRATVLQATPVTWQLLIEAGWRGEPRLKMLCGGEALPRPLANQLLERGGELWNMYGPTETTIWSSALRVEAGEGPVPIGPPIANTQFHVLDPRGELASPGAPGELCIGGDGVARGYFNLPELTEERFIPDPFSATPGARLYRTGDVVRRRDGGRIEFLGRADQQVKLRGFRIELGDIEAALLRHPDIAEAVALAGRDGAGETAIWAYVVPRRGAVPAADWGSLLRRWLGDALPAYMVPAAIAALPALPRTPNGKLDRRALPAPTAAAAAQQAVAEATAPDDLRGRLAGIWREVLGIGAFSPTATFFELGGHSLLAARLLARIEAEFERRVSLAALFQAPTLEALARLLEQPERRVYNFQEVLRLQPNGARPPLLAVNNTGFFYTLSRRLGADQPFTALQLFDPSVPWPELPATIEAMAAEYVRMIIATGGAERCVLLGWCVGGTIAFETARQLRAAGGRVDLLVIVDTWVPGYLKRMTLARRLATDWTFRLKAVVADLGRMRAGEFRLGTFLYRRSTFHRALGLIGRPMIEKVLERPAGADGGENVRYHRWMLTYLRAAAARYEPKPYDGRTLVLRADQEPSGRLLDDSLGWAAFLTGEVQVDAIAGDHTTVFFDPGVRHMAQRIAGQVDAAMAAGGGGRGG